ncbi:hypothetical protein NW765_009788 [Fusarium oxysporum]|nr:hypothetical protein NW765_009788 [Fusarium oxysporum]
MLRLQPTTIKIATRDISDAERRSRYRKHLLSRQKANKRRDDLTQLDQGTVLEDALNTRIVTPTTDSSIGQDTPGSDGRNESDGEEELGSPVPPLDYGTISSEETTYVDVVHGTNRLHRQPDQHRLPFRPRQSLGMSTDQHDEIRSELRQILTSLKMIMKMRILRPSTHNLTIMSGMVP